MPYRGYPDVFPLSSLQNLRLDWFFDTQTQKRNVPPGKPDGQLVEKSLRVFCQAASKLQNFFVVLFCNFAAAAGYLTRKDTLTVSFQLVKKVPSGFLPSCFQNCKMKFCSIILQFCRCGGLLNAKGNPDGFLSHFSSLRNLRLGSFFASPFRKNEMYRPESRTVHFVEKKERERKREKA